MNKLRQLEQEVETLRSKVKAARKADKDVTKLAEWLDELVNEAEIYRNQPWYNQEKLSQSHSFFFKGQTRHGREIAKRFMRWKATRRSAAEVEQEATELLAVVHNAADEIDAIEATENWEQALKTFPKNSKVVPDPQMKDVDLFVIDLSGQLSDLQHTLQTSRIDFSSFHSATLVSPWPKEAELDLSESINLEKVETGFFDLFSKLDALIERSKAKFAMFLSTGSSLMKPLQLPEDWKEYAYILPNAFAASSQTSFPIWDRIDRAKQSLFPQHPPCFLTRTDWLRNDPTLFQHFLSYRPWHLWLKAVSEDQSFLQLEDESVLCPDLGEPNLSDLNRRWLEIENPDLIPELRSSREEWDILKHDLINRVVDANLEFFQKNVAYYAAVTQTGIRR